MTEKDFTKAVVQLAESLGYKTAHFGNTVKLVKRKNGYAAIGDKGAAGFPDLVMVRGDRIVFAELKAKRGILEESQREWLSALEKAGGEVHIWREHIDWPHNVANALA